MTTSLLVALGPLLLTPPALPLVAVLALPESLLGGHPTARLVVLLFVAPGGFLVAMASPLSVVPAANLASLVLAGRLPALAEVIAGVVLAVALIASILFFPLVALLVVERSFSLGVLWEMRHGVIVSVRSRRLAGPSHHLRLSVG